MFGRNKKDNKETNKSVDMKDNLSNLYKNQHDYYFGVIISLLKGSHLQGMGVINLEPIKGWCHFYGLHDTIVYCDDKMKKALLDEGIASYINSSNHLVVTTADYRVEQQQAKFPADY